MSKEERSPWIIDRSEFQAPESARRMEEWNKKLWALFDSRLAEARVKDGELIQQLLDAVWGFHMHEPDYLDAQDAIKAAQAHGFKPSRP